eukprot:scaffold159254_cov22-Tisochrysis_lutea.AAC.2
MDEIHALYSIPILLSCPRKVAGQAVQRTLHSVQRCRAGCSGGLAQCCKVLHKVEHSVAQCCKAAGQAVQRTLHSVAPCLPACLSHHL